ncbi:MAG: (5-formylfuran-3-yl)methyl phosphate synthase [Candidatus Thiodiazotropha sp. 'RUGA']|nr:(5-formylfuran-3-yl)methyl phosphate synthase [Candidatus Thiodiazotropha sp. 'RUGA']
MTRMLASVVDQRELALAVEARVDIIDLKNPQDGALGALPIETICNLVTQCAGRRPVSATVGDLPADPSRMAQAIERTGATGVEYVKIGFFCRDRLTECLQAIQKLASKHCLIAVLFADLDSPTDRLIEFASAGFHGVMVDTAIKGAGGLLHHMDQQQLREFIEEAKSLGLLTGLAGSLRAEDIPQLLPLMPDYLGFRGALCDLTERTARILPHHLQEIRNAVAMPVSGKQENGYQALPHGY